MKALDIGRWRSKARKGERILTLEEALEVFAGKVDLCLDIKNYPKSLPGIELKMLFILSHYDYLDRTIVSSFDYRSLGAYPRIGAGCRHRSHFRFRRQGGPLRSRQALDGDVAPCPEECRNARIFIQPRWEDGLDVHVWTVNELRDIEAFVSMGVQGVISDYPDRLAKLRLR